MLTAHLSPPAALAVALAVGAAFALACARLRWLTPGGALTAGAFAATILAAGTAGHAATGLGFFAVSSALSKLGRGRARALDAVSEKGSVRDAAQVLANGGVAWACLVASALGAGAWSTWGWLGALAAAAADTWATEIGTLAGGPPRLVTTGRRVPAGTSGAVSLVGTAGALGGAAFVGALWAACVPGFGGWGVALVAGAGLAGAFADSLLGATLQARYRTPDGAATERPRGPDGPHARAGGVTWLTNDGVNLAATVAGALAAMALAEMTGRA